MTIEVPQNEEISGERKNEGRKGVGSAVCRRAETLRKESEEELFRDMLTPT